MTQKDAVKMSEKECTMAFFKAGQKFVLVTDGKVYQTVNQNSRLSRPTRALK